jgi:hypothetical protein
MIVAMSGVVLLMIVVAVPAGATSVVMVDMLVGMLAGTPGARIRRPPAFAGSPCCRSDRDDHGDSREDLSSSSPERPLRHHGF